MVGSYPDGSLGSVEDIEILEHQPSFEASSTIHPVSDLWTRDSWVLTALKSVVPRSIFQEIPGSAMVSPSTQIFTSPLHRQILFSVSNNFAGLDNLPVKDVFHFLQKETAENLYRIFRSAQNYSSRMIIQNIFKAAIEVGDARTTDILIHENPRDIKVNEIFCSVEGRNYTPIRRASMLRFEEVVKVLIKHGADVNRTHPDDYRIRPGTLISAVASKEIYHGKSYDIDTHPQIFRHLLEAGGYLSCSQIQTLIKHGEGELTLLLMSANARKNKAEWSKCGIFRDAMHFFDDNTSMEVVRLMLKYGIDLNYHVGGRIPLSISALPHTMMDAAAQRGSVRTVRLLLDSGASLDGDTLPCAIASGNQDLVMFLFSKGADVNRIGLLGVAPIVAAIRLHDAQMLKLIEDRGASIDLQGKNLAAALEAALEVGNIQYVERLIQSGGKLSLCNLDRALRIAIRDGWDEVAKTLIDAGAQARELVLALERRQQDLVLSLLDADADLGSSQNALSLIAMAVEWGNRYVIDNLIFAGAPVHEDALRIAVKRQDYELVQLLLTVRGNVVYRGKSTALEAAAENGDIEMVGFLLDQGASPKDPSALKATFQNEKLFNLIFERYNARYPMDSGGVGAEILAVAIIEGNERVIRLMLGRRVIANVMIPLNKQIATPFGHAIAMQHNNFADCLEIFLQKGRNPNEIVSKITEKPTSAFGRNIRITAFLAAIGTRSALTVELFIRHGADVNFPTRGPVKRTPLQRAAEIGSLDLVDLLINHGANVNAPAAERGGGTALQLAAIRGYIPLACRLLSLNADVNAPRSKINGRTALEGAAEHGRLDMVKLLLNGGAGTGDGGEGQITDAIARARDNGHYPICDLLESHLASRRRQDNERVMLADAADHEDFTKWTLDDDDPFFGSHGGDDSFGF